MNPEQLPALNATLNGAATLFLIVGYLAIRRRRYRTHGWCMSVAFAFSALFLVGYLAHKFVYHGEKTTKMFPGLPGALKVVYFLILVPHLILAMVMLPMIVTVFLRAYWFQWEKHRRLARWTFPIWLYVSATGVIIYWMLYHLFPTMAVR